MALTKQTCQRQNVIKRIIKLIINAPIKCRNQALIKCRNA
ncbi:hypothetical protein HMPREF1574_00463 [Gardnerella pickettii JCP7659]|uniref:Uncharacterized protein n=2 Tax=Gardnerella pickettii TaxID=2914924 RepID=T2PLT0_9BIFI|nr:hypothetical protein HMPREF1576_00094 [Gardnerella pickettii JCP7719]EPI52922.1 hypothetical protein HMPREF1577_00378 [Gardnerella pickettii JCP8017A]EPI55549.1 hypothetical protein HMPREF1574_00463 [Gardnerella pickettii JCP7659]EPI62183.1 hypothetical protein HMPREF1578_00232 [Gardnerella pickettii JCP8017B]